MFDVRAFGELARFLRHKRRMSQEELAERIGAGSIHSIQTIETGSRIWVGYLFDICRELGIDVEFHVTGTHVPAHLAAALSRAFDFTEPEDKIQAILLAELTAQHMAENDLDTGLALAKVESAHEKREAARRKRIEKQAELYRLKRLYKEMTDPDEEAADS